MEYKDRYLVVWNTSKSPHLQRLPSSTNFSKLISLIYGGDFNIFDPPGVPYKPNDEEYEFEVLKRQFQFFGPFPAKYAQIANNDTVEVIIWLMENLQDKMKPFNLISEKEMCQSDKDFIG